MQIKKDGVEIRNDDATADIYAGKGIIRTFMHDSFPRVLDITFALNVLGVLALGIFMMASPRWMFGGITPGLLVILGGLVTLIMLYGGIYLLLEIRDAAERRNR